MSARDAGSAAVGATYRDELLLELPYAVMILDQDWRISYANRKAAELLDHGVLRSLIGVRFDDPSMFGAGRVVSIVDAQGADASGDSHPIARVLDTGRAVLETHLIVDRPHFGRVQLCIDAIPVHSSFGGLSGVGLVMRDRTEEEARRGEGEWLRRELLESRRQIEESLRFSEALNVIGAAVQATLDAGEVLARVLEEAAGALGADFGVIALRESGRWVARAATGLPVSVIGTRFSDEEAPNARRAAETRRPVVIADRPEQPLPALDPGSEFRARTSLSVPLLARDQVSGMISFYYRRQERITNEQVGFAQRVATTTSLGMENARVYSEERHIADTLQRALLVVPDELPGIDFAHLYQSATESAWVGGDFFDLLDLPGDRVGVLIGDISGKGVEASALASFTRQLVKAQAQVYASPAEVVSRTSDLLFRVSRTEDFVTLFLGVLSRADGSLVFCSAGHPAPVIWSGGHGALLHGGGPLAGAWEGLPYEDHQTHLGRGDLLVLYTDGIIEAKRDGELFGEDRLLELVDSLAPCPLEDLATSIVAAVTDFAQGRLRDDVALLLVSPTREPGPS